MPFSDDTKRSRWWRVVAASALALASAGCVVKPPSDSTGSGGGAAPTANLNGNWKFLNPDASTPVMTGGIYQQGATTSAAYTTAVLKVTAPCYTSAPIVPFQGQMSASTLQLASFAVNGQFITLQGDADTSGSTLAGTYNTSGGCQGTTNGKFTAQRYTTLSGNYAGTPAGSIGQRIAVQLQQSTNPTGDGTFLLTGNAVLTGFTCFSSATLNTGDATISGDAVTLALTANDTQQSRIMLNGTVDVAGKNITVSAGQIVGGSCAGNLGALILTSTSAKRYRHQKAQA